jgi:nucleoside-diphosphate kinase
MKKILLSSLLLLGCASLQADESLLLVKPEQVKEQNVGAILKIIEDSGLKIVGLKMTKLSEEKASSFYSSLKDKPFFKDLVSYMTSGPIVAVALEGNNIVERARTLIGSTNPIDASEGTLRKLFGKNIQENAVHGSDSKENAQRELDFFFSKEELFPSA